MLITILAWVAFGLVVGVIARAIYPGPNPMGIVGTIGLGLVGSFVGGLVGQVAVGMPMLDLPNRVHFAGLIGSVLGALLIILLGRLARRGAAT